MATYQAKIGGQLRFDFTMDIRQRKEPLRLGGIATPFLPKDVGNSAATAAIMINDWCRSQGQEFWPQKHDPYVTIDVAPDPEPQKPFDINDILRDA